MFCKWCGEKIVNIGRPCPSCGKSQGPLENGNIFWDLCDKKAEIHPVDTAPTDVLLLENSKAPKESARIENSCSTMEYKPVKKVWGAVWAATTVLLSIAIILIAIDARKTNLCLSEISILRSSIYSTNMLITNGFDRLEEGYSAAEVPEKVKSVTNENVLFDLDRLIEENSLIVNDEALNIKGYFIEGMPGKCVYIADGEMIQNGNVKAFWQKSVDGGENWETFCGDTSYIIAELGEGDIYRIICTIINDSKVIRFYCATTTALEDNVEFRANDTKKDATLTTEEAIEPVDTDETQQNDNLNENIVGDLENSNNKTNGSTDSGNGPVG